MPDDPLSTDVRTDVSSHMKKIVCEFCGCQVTPSGEIIRMGETAKQFRKHEEIVEKKEKEIARLTDELTEAKKKLSALETPSGGDNRNRVGQRVS